MNAKGYKNDGSMARFCEICSLCGCKKYFLLESTLAERIQRGITSAGRVGKIRNQISIGNHAFAPIMALLLQIQGVSRG